MNLTDYTQETFNKLKKKRSSNNGHQCLYIINFVLEQDDQFCLVSKIT